MDLQIKTSHKFSSSNCIQREENYINMGDTENRDLKIIKTDDKTYNLENTEEAINFLIYALNGKRNYCFIEEFVFGHF